MGGPAAEYTKRVFLFYSTCAMSVWLGEEDPLPF
jgi:hypothetical protein